MRLLAVLFALVTLAVAVLAPIPQEPAAKRIPWRLQKIEQVRAETHACQRELGVGVSPVQYRRPAGEAFRAWVLKLWRVRRDAYCGVLHRLNGDPELAIRAVFGTYGDRALAVARCESHLNPHAIGDAGERSVFQIHPVHFGHTVRSTVGRIYVDASRLTDTLYASRVAFVMSRGGTSWGAWTCGRRV